jgi:hypothetical protein
MTMTKVLREVRDVLSSCSVGFLVVYGVHAAFPLSGLAVATEPRWFGLLTLFSAIAAAHRLRIARKSGL